MRKLVVLQWVIIGMLIGALFSTALAQSAGTSWRVEILDQQEGHVDIRVFPPGDQPYEHNQNPAPPAESQPRESRVSAPAIDDPSIVWRGFNWSSAEFGESSIAQSSDAYGSTYTYGHDHQEGPAWTGYLASNGLHLARLSFRWERLQPVPGGDFDPAESARMRAELDMLHDAGAVALPYSHDYFHRQMTDGLYPIMPDGQGEIQVWHWVDFWQRFVDEFGDHPALLGIGLSNEPTNNRPGSVDASQPSYGTYKHAVDVLIDTLRASGFDRVINVPLWGYSTAYYAFERSPELWDAARGHDNIWFEAHQYFDSDMSGGVYDQKFDDQRPAETGQRGAYVDLGVDRIQPFIDWIQAARADGVDADGYVGEYGVPGWPGTDPRWIELLDRFMNRLDEVGFHGTAWRAGVWWTEDPLWVGPYNGGGETSQLATLIAHGTHENGSQSERVASAAPANEPAPAEAELPGPSPFYGFDVALDGHQGVDGTSVERDTSAAHEGEGSLRLSAQADGEVYLRASGPGGLEDWSVYGDTLEAWVRVDGSAERYSFSIALQSNDWEWHESQEHSVVPGNWTLIRWQPPAGVLATKYQVFYRVIASEGSGVISAWVDSIAVR